MADKPDPTEAPERCEACGQCLRLQEVSRVEYYPNGVPKLILFKTWKDREDG